MATRGRALALLLVMLALAPLIAVSSAGQAMIDRWQTSSDTVSGRLAISGDEFLTIAAQSIGNGLGSQSELIAAQASQALGQMVVFSDDVRSRVATESGVLGLIALFLALSWCWR